VDIIFLDASVLFSAAYRAEAKFLELWQMSNIHLVSSLYASEEARRNLEEVEQRERLKTLLRAVKLISALPDRRCLKESTCLRRTSQFCLPPWAAQATHLLTGDLRHFDPYYDKIVEGVLIVSPAGYFKTRLLD
jgi:hypothetical protein